MKSQSECKNCANAEKLRTMMRNDVQMDRLKDLYRLRSFALIPEDEFEARRQLLVDSYTGTKGIGSNNRQSDPWLDARGPPDLTNTPSEQAIKHILRKNGEWKSTPVLVKIEEQLFSKGSIRDAYHCLIMEENGEQQCVAKFSRDPETLRSTYFEDVSMQNYACKFAELYNSFAPPKPVTFIRAWVLELVEREGKPLCGLEKYVAGAYRKHNNNFGYVSEAERNTPQAFSHFTFEASERRVLICDIQGVNDQYTDPQIHAVDSRQRFGQGNMGRQGIESFLATHRCNSICRYLKLPGTNPKTCLDQGTMPCVTLMEPPSVRNGGSIGTSFCCCNIL